MALTTKLAVAVRNSRASAIGTSLNNGYIRIYSGSQPTDPDQAPAGTLLATLRFNATAFGTPSNGTMTANAITPDTNASGTGLATWARLLQSNGTTVVADVSVGEAGTNIILNSAQITAGGTVGLSAWTWTEPMTEGT